MRVLVTGATGFLGANLAVALGDDAVATGRNAAALARLGDRGITTVRLDLAQPIPNADRDRIGSVDAIIHCAGLSSPWGRRQDFVSGNVDGTRHLVQLAADIGVRRFVHVSTASVYFRFADQDCLAEDAPLPPPVNDYALTKRMAEKVVLDAREIGPIIIRPRGIYGAGDTALLPRLLRVAQQRPLPLFDPAGATDITHVDDVARACLAALKTDAVGETINVTGGVGIPLPQIIAAACDAVGLAPRWRRVPFGPTLAATRGIEAVAKLLPGRPEPPVTAYSLGILRYRQTLDVSKAKKLLGWEPQISFEDGLRRTFADGAMRPGVQ